MKVTLFTNPQDTDTSDLRDLSWSDFVDNITPHEFGYENKLDVPCFSPAEYPPGAPRYATAVARVHFACLDLDNLSDEQLNRVGEVAEGLEYLLYTTWSHPEAQDTKGLHKVRLCLPLSRPVERAEWATFFPRMRAKFDNLPDKQCSDPSRIYFIPAAPAGTEEQALVLTQPGQPLNVDEILIGATTTPVVHEQQSIDRVPLRRLDFMHHVRAFKPRTPNDHWLTAKLTQLMLGESYAQEGSRDDTTFRLVCYLVEKFPVATSASIVDLFRDSLIVMEQESADAPTLDDVLKKVERHQATQEEKGLEDAAASMREQRRRIRLAVYNRETPYTNEELVQYALDAECTTEEFGRRWIIQKDAAFYFFVNGKYVGPFTEKECSTAATIYLAPASSADVEVYQATPMGLKPKAPSTLVQEYGQVAHHVNIDLTASRSSYDEKNKVLIEAPCPQRALEPSFSSVVERWLQLFGGEEHEKLLDWLAVVTKLDQPCSALYMDGPKGAGKSLLADAVSRIWSTQGPTALQDAFSQFNSQMIKCPLIFADEAMPTDFKGKGKTGELRQFIQARTRTLRRKFLADATIRGCARLVLAANNKELLATGEHLTQNDIEAIVDRVLYIKVPEAAADFLRSLDAKTRHSLGEGDVIAKHTLWLVHNRRVVVSHRFLVTGEKSELHRSLTTGTGLRSAVCHWLCSYLVEPNKVDSSRLGLIKRENKELAVTVHGLTKYWSMYDTNTDPPPAAVVAKALAGLSAKQAQMVDGQGRRLRYWVVDLENLRSWAEDNGFPDPEPLVAAPMIQKPRATA